MIGKIVLDFSLIIGFGVIHSSLASFRSKELGSIIFSSSRYRLLFSLITAIYILIAAYYWQIIPVLIYSIPSPFSEILKLIILMGWFMYFFSHLAYYEIGGVFGTSQLFSQSKLIRHARFDYSTNGLKKYLRFPVHTAFFLFRS